MPLDHGRKKYYQVLVDPNRSSLIETLAIKEGIKGTSWIRNAVYEKLQREFTITDYKVAEAKDQTIWRESIQRRIDARTKGKKGR